MLQQAIDFVLHLDANLTALSAAYGVWAYALMFFVVFAETGLIIATALPSDTVLFAAGGMASQGIFAVWPLFFGFFAAAYLGDALNYYVGRLLGRRFFYGRKIPFVSREALDKTHAYYDEHGGMAIVAARFVPVLRALAPLVGGFAGMEPRPFLYYNMVGKIIWTPLYVFGGYFFGQIPFIRENFPLLILVAVGIPFCVAALRVAWLMFHKAVNGKG
jgi:membrane-associated protein